MSNGPNKAEVTQAFARFVDTIAALRHPKDGCPWDLEQTHETLRRYMIEEAYEAADAMGQGDSEEIQGELGDVLLQVVLNAQIALDDKRFSLVDVIDGIDEKMRRRHPHVFAKEPGQAQTPGEVRQAWDVIKAQEKGDAKQAEAKGIFKGAERVGPASLQALKIGKIAQKIRFDWDDPTEVQAQVRSEIEEVEEELKRAKRDKAKLAEEIGDVYFSLAQLCRHLDLDPELVALDANRKFLRRFKRLEELAQQRGKAVPDSSREELEALWKAVKQEE
jgi:ATP diphosphatase